MRFFIHPASKVRSAYILSMAAGISVTLSLGHHWFDFWELTWERQLVLLLAVFPLTWLFSRIFLRIGPLCAGIHLKRWFLFIFPTFMVTGLLAWYFYRLPVVWHSLEIIPLPSGASTEIKLVEIKLPPGKVVNLSSLKRPDGWILDGETLKSTGSSATPMQYSFRAPVGRPVGFTFQSSPMSHDVRLILDGQEALVGLADPAYGHLYSQLDTRYKSGIPGWIPNVLIVLSDFITAGLAITIIWLFQEIPQSVPQVLGNLCTGLISARTALFLLLVFSLILHAINFLTMPLLLASDGWSYLQGAVHLLQFGNLDGVPSARGPGTTFLFYPALVLFGNHPWGVKFMLHLLSVACIPVAYRLGWQLFRKGWAAVLAAAIALLTPDLLLYSNVVMSDVPNVFFGLLFTTLLLSALDNPSFRWLLGTFCAGSFLILLRAENVIIFILGIGFVTLKILLGAGGVSGDAGAARRRVRATWAYFSLSVAIALVPVLTWSYHNLRLHGFFGMSNYGGVVLYDGWIYYGEASNIPITDPGSPAVQAIEEAYNAYDQAGMGIIKVPTGYERYPALISWGYTDEETIALLGQAAKDSILKHPELAWQVLTLKVTKSLRPSPVLTDTLLLPGEQAANLPSETYFSPEPGAEPGLIILQREMFDLMRLGYRRYYPALVWISLCAMLLAFYRKEIFVWYPLIAITVSRVIFPVILGLGTWRYVISGVILLFMFSLAGLKSVIESVEIILKPPRHR